MLLKKSEHMTVAEMSKEMGITPMAVRQHLMSLEKRGIINYSTKKYGIGRPVFLYRLTERARDFFPKAYGEFVNEMLHTIVKMDGRKKLEKLFQERKDKLLKARLSAMGEIKPVEQRVRALAKLLDAEGYMVDVEDDGDYLDLKEFNCLLHSVAEEFPEACKYELDLYRNLLGNDVERTECQRDGFPACVYKIPKGLPS